VRILASVALVALTGCSGTIGGVGVVGPDADDVGVKLLRPGVSVRACRTSVLGFGGGAVDPLESALARLLAADGEANVATRVRVRSSVIVTGLYNRRCVELSGDVGRLIPTVVLPSPPGHAGH
jgi:hypothetical protein